MDVVDLTLPSLTVFWKDLGFDYEKLSKDEQKRIANLWDSDIGPWLDEFAKGDVRPYRSGVWFADPKDAMLYKMTWSGRIV